MTPYSSFFPDLSGGVSSLSPRLPGYLRAPGKLVQQQGAGAGVPESSPRLAWSVNPSRGEFSHTVMLLYPVTSRWQYPPACCHLSQTQGRALRGAP